MRPDVHQRIPPRLPRNIGRWWRGATEAVVVLVAYSAYEWVRAQVGRESPAYHNAVWLMHAERFLHIAAEDEVQRFFLPHKTWLQFLNIYYGTVHFVVPVIVLWLLWKKTPSQYLVWRNRVVATTLLALIGFWLWPVMPPRLMPAHFGYIDTDALYGGLGVLNEGSMKDTNLYAAMPSLHVGWAVWCAAAGVTITGNKAWRLLLCSYPVLTFATVTATGNHYWLDAVAGVAVDIAGYYLGGWATGLLAGGGQLGRFRRFIRGAGQHDNANGDGQRGDEGKGERQRAVVDGLVK